MVSPRATEDRIGENVNSAEGGYFHSTDPSIHPSRPVETVIRRKKNKSRSKIPYVLFLIFLFIISNIGGLYLNSKTFIVNVSGSSMLPTFHNSDFVILWKKPIRDGNIVTFKKPSTWKGGREDDFILIKRIEARGGDLLSINSTSIRVNGKIIYTFYPGECPNLRPYEHRLNAHEFFPLGDNAKISLDSRHQYCVSNEKNMLVPVNNLLNSGKVLVKI